MDKKTDATITGVALVEATVIEDVERIQRTVGLIEPEQMPVIIQFYASLLASLLEKHYGITGAIEEISRWREQLYAGLIE